MKRLFLVLIAVMSMTMTFADNENTNSVNNVNAYDMSVNVRKLGETLGLSYDQMESVGDVHRTFCGEMMVASQSKTDDRVKLVRKAVTKDLKYMHYILNNEQYHKYLALLNATMVNRGIEY